MSYLHPAYYPLLPATARPQLIAFLAAVQRLQFASKDGWCDARQSFFAAELCRSLRSVKLYELVCERAGLLRVERAGPNNRRRLHLVSAKAARAANPKPSSKPIREWCNALHHSGATGDTTPAKSHLLPRARSLRGSSSDSQTPKPASPAERAAHDRRDPEARTGISEPVLRRTKALVEPLGVRWAPKIAELVFRLVRAQGERLALGYLDLVEQRTASARDGYPRAKATVAMLEARLSKLRERAAPRTHG